MNFQQKIRLLISIIIALSLISISVVSAAPKSPFIGAWRAVDLDGSNMQVSIAGGGSGVFRLTWTDDFWSVCGGQPGIGRGIGSLDTGDPNILITDWVLICTSLRESYEFPFEIIYDADTDTIEFQDVVWTRIRR